MSAKVYKCQGCGTSFKRQRSVPSRTPRYCTRECAIRKHNSTCIGYSKGKLFAVWASMIQRCENPNHRAYHLYGGRGVRICKSWRKSYLRFAANVGHPPPNTSIDRYPDPNGDYRPSNVRWATRAEQAHNLRSTKLKWEIVNLIRERVIAGETRAAVAASLNISRSEVSLIAANKIWRVEDPRPNPPPKLKLTDAQVRDIRRRLVLGERGRTLAAVYRVSPAMISMIKHGLTRKVA